jgi:hypothetical protein
MNVQRNTDEQTRLTKQDQQEIKKQEMKEDEEKNFVDQGHPSGCYCRHHMKEI